LAEDDGDDCNLSNSDKRKSAGNGRIFAEREEEYADSSVVDSVVRRIGKDALGSVFSDGQYIGMESGFGFARQEDGRMRIFAARFGIGIESVYTLEV